MRGTWRWAVLVVPVVLGAGCIPLPSPEEDPRSVGAVSSTDGTVGPFDQTDTLIMTVPDVGSYEAHIDIPDCADGITLHVVGTNKDGDPIDSQYFCNGSDLDTAQLLEGATELSMTISAPPDANGPVPYTLVLS